MEKILKKSKSGLKKKLGGSKNPKLLVHSITDVQENTDALVKKRISSKEVSFECNKGCNICCNLRVEVLPPEAFKIANYIKSKSDDTIKDYVVKLSEHSTSSKGRTFEDYDKPCPFLTTAGSCGIYEIRPHKCRAYLSKKLSVCQSGRDAEEDEELSIATAKLALESVAIFKSKGCVMHPAELGQSVLATLEDNSLQNRWADGEQVFELLPERIKL